MATVTFIGHRDVSKTYIKNKLESLLRKLAAKNKELECLVGHNGGFGLMTASVVAKLKHSMSEAEIVPILCLPYMTAEYRNYIGKFEEVYDKIEITSSDVHFKSAIPDQKK